MTDSSTFTSKPRLLRKRSRGGGGGGGGGWGGEGGGGLGDERPQLTLWVFVTKQNKVLLPLTSAEELAFSTGSHCGLGDSEDGPGFLRRSAPRRQEKKTRLPLSDRSKKRLKSGCRTQRTSLDSDNSRGRATLPLRLARRQVRERTV